MTDMCQQPYRNAALLAAMDDYSRKQRNLEELAQQAKLDREANDRLRTQLTTIAKQQLNILEEEQMAKEVAKQQNNLIFDISWQLKNLDADPVSPMEKFRRLHDLKRQLENIVIDAVTDLQYKSLYSETQSFWQRLLEKFKLEHAGNFAVYKKCLDLEQQVESYLGDLKVCSAKELSETRHLVEELKIFAAEHPDLAPTEDEIELVQKSADDFMKTAATMKGLWTTLNAKQQITSHADLEFLLCAYFGIEEDIFSSDLWGQLNEVECSQVAIDRFYDFCLNAVATNSSLSDTVLRIFDSVEYPQTMPAVQRARGILYSKLVDVLNTRNQTAKRRITKKVKESFCIGCMAFIVIPIIALFCPAVLLGLIWGVFILLKSGYDSIKLPRTPLPKLESALKRKYYQLQTNKKSTKKSNA